MSKWNHLPIAVPGCGLLPHISARLRTEIIDAVFVETGGPERLAGWANKSDENYGEFIKIWARGAARHSNVEVNAGEGIEKLLERLDERDRQEGAKVINAEAREISDASE